MVWSNWRGTVAVTLAWVGLAWSQAPTSTTAPASGERIMTVHENGKSIRCRIVSTWRTTEGAQAYQLQALESGEAITIVEDGPAASVEEPTLVGKVRALPMRIFHWGRNRVTPPGVPAAPEEIALDAPATEEPAVVAAKVAPVVVESVHAAPESARPVCASPVCASPVSTSPVTTKAIGKNQIVWWEEKNGKRVSPMIVTDGKNPFEQGPTIHTLPSTASVPMIADNGQKSATAARVPIVVDTSTTPTQGSAKIVTTAPATNTTDAANRSVLPSPEGEAAAMGTTAPATRPIVKAAPLSPVRTAVIAQGAGARGESAAPKARAEPAQPAVTTMELTAAPPKDEGTPPAAPNAVAKSQLQYIQSGPTLLPEVPQPVANGPTLAVQAGNTAGSVSNTVAASQGTKPPIPAVSPRLSLAERLHNLLHPKRETTVVTTPETKQVAANDAHINTTPVAAAPSPATGTAPFSTAADQSAKPSTLPPVAPTNTQAIANANPSAPPVGPPTAAAASLTQAAPGGPAPDAAPQARSKDWRTMWGQSRDTKTQAPGQSLVDQASAKPNLTGIPSLQNPPAGVKLPPASTVDQQTADILLSPEKFDPSGARLIPKGIHMNSYRGDPASLMTKAATPSATQAAAQASANQAPLFQTTAMQAPPLPGKEARPPVGAQSVLAANPNGPASVAYVPAPTGNGPDYRLPAPPAPRLPEPAQPNAYANAFTPAPVRPQNATATNAFSNMNVQPSAMQVAQNIPQSPSSNSNFGAGTYQPNPMAQGYPMAPGYPPNPNVMMAQGVPNPYYYAPQVPMQAPPLPTPPVAQANFPQPYGGPQFSNSPQARQSVQPAQYNPAPAAQTTTNTTMDRRPASPNAGSNAELIQVLKVLRESPYPAQREWASNTLGTYDWRAHPEIVQLLLQAAQQDPAATVRASCVYSLAHMNAASEPVLSTLYMLRNDGDPRVRQEVEQALVRLKN